MAHKTPQGTWRVRWIGVDGQRRSKCFKTRARALTFEVKVCETHIAPEPVKMTFGEFSGIWLEKYCRLEKAPSQWVEDERVIKRHLVKAFGEVPLGKVQGQHLQRLKEDLAPSLSAKTVNNILGLAKKMMTTAVKWQFIATSPFQIVDQMKATEQGFDYWRNEERDFLARRGKAVDPEFTRAVVTACHTGMRRGELAGLRRYHLDFEKRLIEVSETFCFKSQKFQGRTKTGTRAFIPMSETVYRELLPMKLMAPDSLIFGPELLRHATQRLGQLCKKIGARRVHFHATRHTFASSLVSAGVPLYTVQKLMRHKTVSMTQRYAHLAPGYLQEAIEAIAPKNSRPDSALIGSHDVGSTGDLRGKLEPQTGFEQDLAG